MEKSGFQQSLLVKHLEDTKFEAMEATNGAPRPQFVYRRLGVEEATGGAYDAHVIKGVPGSKPPIAEHKHTELDFLFVYVLKGWMSFHYHGHGEHKLNAGDCHIIPPGLSHTVTGWSEDVELLEITAPGPTPSSGPSSRNRTSRSRRWSDGTSSGASTTRRRASTTS